MIRLSILASLLLSVIVFSSTVSAKEKQDPKATAFYEQHIRPLLIKHCYECHSEKMEEQQGGLLLDRKSSWMKGGTSGKAIIPGNPNGSLLIKAVRYGNEDYQMPPDGKLSDKEIKLLERWVKLGAPGPAVDLAASEFSRLGDQKYLFSESENHWAFQHIKVVPPNLTDEADKKWSRLDQYIIAKHNEKKLSFTRAADPRSLLRRVTYDLTGLPPTREQVESFIKASKTNRREAYIKHVDRLIASPQFGEQFSKLWLDVARYADTDSTYRADTRTPHYYPFAYTYRDYVIRSFNEDKPYDQFVREQLAADLMESTKDSENLAALGFLTVGPHGRRRNEETIDDWIDTTSRGLLGLTVACARCHDHKFEPIPTADYYSLYAVFDSVQRSKSLDDKKLPQIPGYEVDEKAKTDYQKQREKLDKQITGAGGKRQRNNNRLKVADRIRETDLAELLLFHEGAPAHAVVVTENKRPTDGFVFIRGSKRDRGERVPRRFLKVLDEQQKPFSKSSSGRLELANKIVSEENPLASRVFVNRVFGKLMDQYLVETPSDFGLQGAKPTYPHLLDWLAHDFMKHDWSLKHLVRQIVLSRTYQQASTTDPKMEAIDQENKFLWRANRKRLSIEQIRDSILKISGQLDERLYGHPERLWEEEYTRRRSIYGFVNRFNLDPTLRVFDFPSRMHSAGERIESIVSQQALFFMNSSFVIDQSIALTTSKEFEKLTTNEDRVLYLFESILQRKAYPPEVARISKFVEQQNRFFEKPTKRTEMTSAWPLAAQALFMSTEFQYID